MTTVNANAEVTALSHLSGSQCTAELMAGLDEGAVGAHRHSTLYVFEDLFYF